MSAIQRKLIAERIESRKALFSALVAQSANVETARREIAIARAKADADERRLEESIRTLPSKLESLQREIASLEKEAISPEDALFMALFGK